MNTAGRHIHANRENQQPGNDFPLMMNMNIHVSLIASKTTPQVWSKLGYSSPCRPTQWCPGTVEACSKSWAWYGARSLFSLPVCVCLWWSVHGAETTSPAIKAAQDDFFSAHRQMPLENERMSFDVTSNHRGKIPNGLLNRSGTWSHYVLFVLGHLYHSFRCYGHKVSQKPCKKLKVNGHNKSREVYKTLSDWKAITLSCKTH